MMFLNQGIGGLTADLRKLGRGMKTVSGEAKALLPIVGEWKGDLHSPGLILVGRRGQLMFWSPFGPALIPQQGVMIQPNENFNLCVAGVSGSGKSVFLQEIMLSILGVGGKVFILDYDRSFQRTCQILKGNYIAFDLQRPVSLNPFSEISEKQADFEDRTVALANISSVLASMAAPLDGVTDLQNEALQEALAAVWEAKKSKAEITDVADWLLKQKDDGDKNLGRMLYPFTNRGKYGKFFSGPAGISLNNKIVVIETENLRAETELLSVVIQMMIVHINQAMIKGDRKHPFLIMIDEAKKLLTGKASGNFIEEMARVTRKYKGSIMSASQQLTDFFNPNAPAAEKAFENSSWKLILKLDLFQFRFL